MDFSSLPPVPPQREDFSTVDAGTFAPDEALPSRGDGETSCRLWVWGATEDELLFLRELMERVQARSPFERRYQLMPASALRDTSGQSESTGENEMPDVWLVAADSAPEVIKWGKQLEVAPFLVVLRGEETTVASIRSVLDAGASDCLSWNELSTSLLERALRFALQNARTRKQLAKAEQSKAQFALALEHSSLGVMMCGPLLDDCPILWVNPAMEAITGFSSSEMLGRNPRLLSGENTDARALAAIRTSLQEERAVQVTLLNYRRDRTPFWNEVHIAPLRGAGGEVTGWMGYTNDVTRRVESEGALQESRRDLEFAQRLTRLGSWWMALGQGVELWHAQAFWSDELYRMVGMAPGKVESSPRGWDAFVHPDDRARVRVFMESLEAPDAEDKVLDGVQVRHEAPVFSLEYRLCLRDGSEKWVQCNAQIERDASGKKTRIVGTILDISERLRESERRTRAVVQNAPLILWSLDAAGVFTSVQGRALSSVRLEAAQLIGKSFFEVMGQDEAVTDLVRRALGGEECEGAMWFGERYLIIRYAPLPEGGALGVGVDMTEGARQKWLDSQRRFESIVANVPGVVYRFVLSPEGETKFEFVSPRAHEFWGDGSAWNGNELEGLKLRMPPEDYESLLSSIGQSARELSPWSWRGRFFDGSEGVRWMHALSQPFRREDGAIVWDGLILDETESHLSRLELERSQAALEEAQSLARVGSFDLNFQSGEVIWSKTMFRIFGYEPNEFTPDANSVREHLHPDDHWALEQGVMEHVSPSGDGSYLVRVRCKEGQERFLQTYSQIELDDEGQPLRLVGSAQDVTEKILAERALRANEERYALAARGSNDGLWDWDLERNTLYASPRWREMIGCAHYPEDGSARLWVERVHPDDQASAEAALQAHLRGETAHFEAEYRLRHENGEWLWMLGRGLAVRDGRGRATRIAGSQTDISARKRFEAQLAQSAFYDALTGLPNRVLFHKQLERSLARASREPDHLFAVLFLDLDRFKNINDSLGHIAGDQVLVEAGRRFESCLRPGDTVARLGGDEFAVLLDGVADESAIEAIAGRINAELEKPFLLGGREVFITVSIGVAPSQGRDAPAVDLLRDADTAMYRAKGAGRARHTLFDATMHQSAVRLLELESDLWRALERDELRLHFQPIIALESGEIHGFEALVRWQHPERGLVSPGEFIPLAEETGLIVPVGWWVLETACRQAVAWNRDRQQPLAMAVNLSSQGFSQDDFVERVRATLEQTGFDPHLLTLEITESILMQNTESASVMLRELRAMGITLAMDDFGTGYSSLSYLHRFTIDVLKVDRSFVAQLSAQGKNEQIVSTILHLAQGLNLRAVAEGIESEEQLRLVRGLGCPFAQGFYFARPLPPEGIERLLEQDPRW